MRLHYPATARNREPLLAALRSRLPAQGTVLELASGSGEHAVSFAAALPQLRWQPSDPDPAARDSIAAWVEHEGLSNVLPPVDLDVTQWPWPIVEADAVLCVNMIHIAPWEATLGLMAGAARVLPPGGPIFLYGPFVVDGETAASNREFDASLRRRDPRWGVRELRDVEREAERHGLGLVETVAMPANNLVVVLRLLISAMVVTACATAPPPSGRAPAVDGKTPGSAPRPFRPAASQAYPRIRLDVSNPAADEGEFWRIEIHADRSLTREHTWSDGAQDTVQTCTTVLPPEDVDPWLRRLAQDATLESPPPRARRPDGDLRGYDYTVGYAAEAGTVRYADPGSWRVELDVWFERVRLVAGECSEVSP